MNKRGKNVGIDNSLDLSRVAGSNIGNSPACLLTDAVFGGAQQGKERWECPAIDDNLGLDVIACHNVTNGPQSGRLHRSRGVHQQLDETARNAGLNDSLDLVVRAVREIGDGPAGIDEDLIIERIDKFGEHGESWGNLLPVSSDQPSKTKGNLSYLSPIGLRSLSSAEVAECPSRVPKHAQLAAVTEQGQQGPQGACVEDKVPACGAITSNVTKSPNSLFSDVGFMAAEQFDENGNGASLDDDLCLLSRT